MLGNACLTTSAYLGSGPVWGLPPSRWAAALKAVACWLCWLSVRSVNSLISGFAAGPPMKGRLNPNW
jgi:hypothetical protein